MKAKHWINSQQARKSILVVTLAMLTMVGCANGNDSKDKGGARLTGRDSIGAASTSNGTSNVSSSGMSALVYNSSVTGGNVNTSAQGLLALSMPQGTQIGSIDANSGMKFTGHVHFDSSSPTQNLIPTQSYIEIQIADSLSVTSPSQYSPFILSLGMNSSSYGTLSYGGTYNGAGYNTTQMVFQDQYGWVMVYGNMNGQSFQGRVYWGTGQFNSATVWNYLGDFTTQSCGAAGFFSC